MKTKRSLYFRPEWYQRSTLLCLRVGCCGGVERGLLSYNQVRKDPQMNEVDTLTVADSHYIGTI